VFTLNFEFLVKIWLLYEKLVVLIGAAQIGLLQLWLRGPCLADY